MLVKIKSLLLEILLYTDNVIKDQFLNTKDEVHSSFNNYKEFVEKETLVVMASWKRSKYLPNILKQLELQTYNNFNFVIWNNNRSDYNLLNETAKKSKLDIEILHSINNVGGFGRFYAVRRSIQKGRKYKYVIFIDDDQKLNKDFFKIFVEEIRSKKKSSYASSAFIFNSYKNYWDRQLGSFDDEVDYLATQGMILDFIVFNIKDIYKCPKRYWYIEDLWLSFILKNNGYSLRKSLNETIEIKKGSFVDNGLFTKKHIKHKKTKLLQYIIKNGFKTVNKLNI